MGLKQHRSLLNRALLLQHQQNRLGKNNNQISVSSSVSEVSEIGSEEEISEEEMTGEEFLESLYGPLTLQHRDISPTPLDKTSLLK